MKTEQELFEEFQLFKLFQQQQSKPNRSLKKKLNKNDAGYGTVYKLSGNRKRGYTIAKYATLGEKAMRKQYQIAYVENEDIGWKALDILNKELDGIAKSGSFLEYIAQNNGKTTKHFQSVYNALNANFEQNNTNDTELTNVNVNIPTIKEIWKIIYDDLLSKVSTNKLSKSTIGSYTTGANKIKSLFDKKINSISLHDIQPLFDKEMEKGSCDKTLYNMKHTLELIFEYAIRFDFVKRDYSQDVRYYGTNNKKNDRKPFTHEEIALLFEDNSFESKIVLIYIYTGMRPIELMLLSNDSINLDDYYIIGGVKTDAGRERIIPIHNAIYGYIKELAVQSKNKKYILFEDNTRKYATQCYRDEIFKPLMQKLKLDHEPYDTRYTFATIAKESGMNEFARKKIFGHSDNDLTDRVYTHVSIEYLHQEMNKIPTYNE